MTEERSDPGRPWYATWFWRSLTLLTLGLAPMAHGEVWVLSLSQGVPPPVLPDYTLLPPNLAVLLGSSVALVGAAMALITACAALLKVVRKRRVASGLQDGIPGRGDRHTK
jgi:hypothetical protein